MKILVAGATGVIGRQVVPLLTETGHQPIALARSRARADVVDADLVTVDALDRPALTAAVRRIAPDAVVNLLTAIPGDMDPRRFGDAMATTNRLRTEATANLVAAAGRAHLVTEGLAYAYRPGHGATADEHRALWDDGPKPFRPAVQALRTAERLTYEVDGTVLRFGHLYGPGTVFAPDGAVVTQVRAGRLPIVGGGDSVFSFLHTRDAATAVVAALETRLPGAFNVVDDDPVPIRRWLPGLARLVGAPAPRRIPRFVARVAAGPWGTAYLTELVGADNGRARRELEWRPSFPSWEDGFAHELAPLRGSEAA